MVKISSHLMGRILIRVRCLGEALTGKTPPGALMFLPFVLQAASLQLSGKE